MMSFLCSRLITTDLVFQSPQSENPAGLGELIQKSCSQKLMDPDGFLITLEDFHASAGDSAMVLSALWNEGMTR